MKNQKKISGSPINLLQIGAYASPALITTLAWMPLGYVIVKFYAKYTSLDLATIGSIILFARLFDAFSDPLVAWLSDSFSTKWGRRKPWIVLSAPIAATGFALTFMPPADISWVYFLVANITLYVGWTFFEITHISWGLEVVRDHDKRIQLGVILKVFAYAGSLLFFAFPFLFNTDPNSTEFTRPVMNALGLSVALAFPILALFSVKVVPKETPIGNKEFSFKEALAEILQNKTFRIYAGAFALWSLSDALIVALFLVYIDVYLNLSSLEGIILLATYFSRLLAAPLAFMVLKKYPQKTLWVIATIGNAAVLPLIALFPSGEAATFMIIAYAIILGLFDCLIGILVITMLGTVIDRDAITTGRDKAASYKASLNLIEKTVRAIGTSSALMIVGTAGLTVGEENTPTAILTLIIILALGPAVLNLASAFTMGKFPINEHSKTP